MMLSTRWVVLSALSLGLLAWAPGASAATLGGIGTLQYNDAADASRNSVLVTRIGDDLQYHGTPMLTVSPPCTAIGTTDGRCPPQTVHSFLMGSANDQVIFAPDPRFGDTVAMDGGVGNDVLINGEVPFDADHGPTSLMTGDEGDDQMLAAISVGTSSLIGGGGTDLADLRVDPAPLNVSLDGLANDGAAGAQTSNADAENVFVSSGNVTGSSADNVIKVSVGGSVNGAGGNDTITIGNGADVADGGFGNDAISTGTGTDSIDPGPGTDIVSSSDGNDTINSRDGEADQIDCGNGIDTLIADAADVHSSDCETVQLPASSSSAPPANTFSFGNTKSNKKRGTATLVVALRGAGVLALNGGTQVRSVTMQIAASGNVKLPIRPKGKAKRRLEDTGTAKVKVTVTFTPAGGTAHAETKALKLVSVRGR